MSAGIANNVLLFRRISYRLISDSGPRQRAGIQPERMFTRVVHYHGPVRNRAVQQFMRGGSMAESVLKSARTNRIFSLGWPAA